MIYFGLKTAVVSIETTAVFCTFDLVAITEVLICKMNGSKCVF